MPLPYVIYGIVSAKKGPNEYNIISCTRNRNVCLIKNSAPCEILQFSVRNKQCHFRLLEYQKMIVNLEKTCVRSNDPIYRYGIIRRYSGCSGLCPDD